MAERGFRVADVETSFTQAEIQGDAVGKRNPLAGEQRLHFGDQRIASLKAAKLRLPEQQSRAIRERLGGSLDPVQTLGLPSELDIERTAVGDGVHLCGAGQL